MSAFRVGQKVVCVDDSGCAKGVLKKNKIYEIAKVGVYRDLYGVRLTEGPQADTAPLDWFASRFRPLVTRKTDISCFEALLNTKSEKELV